MRSRVRLAFAVALTAGVLAPSVRAADFTVRVDARDVARGILHVTQTFPASGGTLALSYPRWIPGEHGPTDRARTSWDSWRRRAHACSRGGGTRRT
jgi:hypothetical protein